ncbi:hypothetical protein M2222_009385 [Bradyrhizobium elkanii]|nr:hypothetical protein [Bradyrhizobium elkanii]MCS3567004.1 hypothetical protein [Bradyrhizobium elkanii]MCW2153905.1 hypothetical protein [Bradyrhizobium elkanii]MCW2380263.1 hypothetical protein [Bradyrhizobium elkanii]
MSLSIRSPVSRRMVTSPRSRHLCTRARMTGAKLADAGLGQPLGQKRRLDRIARLPVRDAVLGDQRSAKQFGRDAFDQRRGYVLVPEQCESVRIQTGHQVSGRAEIQPEVVAQRPFRAPQQARQVADDSGKMTDKGESAGHDRDVVP